MRHKPVNRILRELNVFFLIFVLLFLLFLNRTESLVFMTKKILYLVLKGNFSRVTLSLAKKILEIQSPL